MTPNHEKENSSPQNTLGRKAGNYIIGYLFFVIFLFLIAFLLFRIRANAIQIAFLLGNNEVKVKGISNLVVLISAVIMLAGVMFSEDYLRKGINSNRMWKHILRIFVFTSSIILMSLTLYYLLLIIFT